MNKKRVKLNSAGPGIDRLPSPDDLRRLYGQAPAADRRKGAKPGKAELEKLYSREGKSVRDIAAALGCSKDIVHRALKQYQIPARSKAGANIKRSKLWAIRLRDIENEVKARGLRGAALALGVDHGALCNHLKARRGGSK